MSQSFATGFDRTFGALTDALGLSPMRKLQEAWQQIVSASVAQNQARASYAALVQTAFSAGFDGLLHKLAEKGHKGERVDSVLALLRLWAIETENAVHRVLQSEQGMAATAAVARSGLAYRRNVQRFAAIIADALDMTTRRDLDEAFREIQELKREVRKLRPPVAVGTTSRKAQGTVRKRTGT